MVCGCGLARAWADGNVVSTWSIERSKKEGWFIAELAVGEHKRSYKWKTAEIGEAWIEQAHRVNYVMGIFPKRAKLPRYWVCMSFKDPQGMFLCSASRCFRVSVQLGRGDGYGQTR